MIIDFRSRPPLKEYGTFFVKDRLKLSAHKKETLVPESYLQDSVEMWIKEMDEAGISISVITGRNIPFCQVPNDLLAKFQKEHEGRVIALAGIDPSGSLHDPVKEVERSIKELGLKGVNIDPGLCGGEGLYPDDKRVYPIYEKCNELNVPVLIMTGPYSGKNFSYGHPMHFDNICRDFPQLRVIAGHGCFPYITEAVAAGFKHQNLFISPDVYMFFPGNDHYVSAINSILRDQMLFASAFPFRAFKETVDDTMKLGIKEEVLDKYLYKNAQRALGLV